MNEFLLQAWHYLAKASVASFTQIIIIFGPLLLLAFLMNFIASSCERISLKVIREDIYLYLFAWLGTTIHEAGHALFAVIFRHKINKIKFFSPDPATGTLGYVDHSYNKKSLYQQVGNLFIGIGPIIMCCLVLYALSYLLFRIKLNNLSTLTINTETFHSSATFMAAVAEIWSGIKAFVSEVFSGSHSSFLKVAIFVYCFYSIGSSITLSKSDLATSGKGFLTVVIAIFVFNMATIWKGGFATVFATKLSAFFSGFYFIIILAAIINLFFILVLSIVSGIKSRG
jgi:hypothetical protein